MSCPEPRTGAAAAARPPLDPPADLFAYLAGPWHVERSAEDRAFAMTGRFRGAAVFGPLGDGVPGLLYEESGTFEWGGVERAARRVHRWLPGERPGTARVEFEDGRFFHDLDLRTGHDTVDHPCSLDLYRGEFTVVDARHWSTVWRVAGPAKDLVLRTSYRRDGEGGAVT
ncbi:DUF6314 family protein [Streptomyces sp. NPDC049954]|uniref:DUF6314 family protein n=1 Tax=Streptomyces sp. NPDC049954 TaxID=3155779 RepID=UPI003429C620